MKQLDPIGRASRERLRIALILSPVGLALVSLFLYIFGLYVFPVVETCLPSLPTRGPAGSGSCPQLNPAYATGSELFLWLAVISTIVVVALLLLRTGAAPEKKSISDGP